MMRTKICLAFLIIMAALNLQGCILLAAGAGAATTVAVVHDRRPLQTIADDQNIELTANSQANQNLKWAQDSHIVIVSFNHAVLLIGQAADQKTRQQVESMVQALPKVARIYNQLDILPPTTPTIRSNDAWITTKVKTHLIETANVHSAQIKVVTENGNVYLLGIVNHHQADMAADVARRVGGVKKVVTLFEFILE
jgi:osmotically-inducible protein OsmY